MKAALGTPEDMTLGEAMEVLPSPQYGCACAGNVWCCLRVWQQAKALRRAAHIVADLLYQAQAMFCFWHHVWEPDNDDTFKVCFECQHVYQTEQDLLGTFNEKMPPLGIERRDSAEGIDWCPLCAHSF